ncbi:unnamed protein product [Callosobruchus maculatus]|uniref:Actin interacting protein 3-like C-terminal domain-containing protein n=1 Tax=Callosobruchus maculatus TaxID=64391 RepID=A0A653D1A1_CALMS|nr:unnamed protein product [Callosobruchus maculatus]
MGSTASLPRGAALLRTYSPAVASLSADRMKSVPADGYMSSPERSSRYEDPYYSQYAARSGSITPVIDEEIRLRVENMERQLANLTGLVQKALTQPAPGHLQVPGRDSYRERDGRLKPAPSKPMPLNHSGSYDGSTGAYRDLQLTAETYNQLRCLQKKAKELRAEARNLRRMSQAQAHSVKETVRDAFIKIRAVLMAGGEQLWQTGMDQERVRLSREEDLYKQEMMRLEKDLSDLESTVEELRGNVINRKTRVNMSDVENMALILSKSSKTVADLKLRFPGLQDSMKSFLNTEMEKMMREEKFLKEEPERLESALRRCKKLTGTLVTLKRLASVQEQRLPCSNSVDGRLSPSTETPPITPSSTHSKGVRMGSVSIGGDPGLSPVGGGSPGGGSESGGSCSGGGGHACRPENALDALLDELQTFSRPASSTAAAGQAGNTAADGGGRSLNNREGEQQRKGSMDSQQPHHPPSALQVTPLPLQPGGVGLRRLHSYPSGSDTDNSPPIQPLKAALGAASGGGKPPLPERTDAFGGGPTTTASGKRMPPPPPPRTSSKSPIASPTSPRLPPRAPVSASNPAVHNLQHIQNVQQQSTSSDESSCNSQGKTEDKPLSQFEQATQNLGLQTLRRSRGLSQGGAGSDQSQGGLLQYNSKPSDRSQTLPRNLGSTLLQTAPQPQAVAAVVAAGDVVSNSSSCESINSQDGGKNKTRKEELEQRHQELLKKQKALQEQYARLQQLQRGTNALAVIPPDQLLKKTGSESNLLQKMGLQLATQQQMTGSLTNLPAKAQQLQQAQQQTGDGGKPENNVAKETKVYETDIL